MVITLTTRCNECCSHCMDCCGPEGSDMEFGTLVSAVSFALASGVHVLELSGGEALLHSNWRGCLEHVLSMINGHVLNGGDPCGVVLASNGHPFLESVEVRDYFKNRLPDVVGSKFFLKVQVTVDSRFYPNAGVLYAGMGELREVLGDRLVLVEELSHLVALGRAKNLVSQGIMLGSGKPLSPGCSNPLLMSRQVSTWCDFVKTFESMGKFCHPMVDIYGGLHVSECLSCPVYGNVNEWFTNRDYWGDVLHDTAAMDRSCQDLLETLRGMRCCGSCVSGPHKELLERFGLLECVE